MPAEAGRDRRKVDGRPNLHNAGQMAVAQPADDSSPWEGSSVVSSESDFECVENADEEFEPVPGLDEVASRIQRCIRQRQTSRQHDPDHKDNGADFLFGTSVAVGPEIEPSLLEGVIDEQARAIQRAARKLLRRSRSRSHEAHAVIIQRAYVKRMRRDTPRCTGSEAGPPNAGQLGFSTDHVPDDRTKEHKRDPRRRRWRLSFLRAQAAVEMNKESVLSSTRFSVPSAAA